MSNIRPEHIISAVGACIEQTMNESGISGFDVQLLKTKSLNTKNDCVLIGLGFFVDIDPIKGFEPKQVMGRLTIEFYECQFDQQAQVWVGDSFYKVSSDTSENAIYWGAGGMTGFANDFEQLKRLDEKSESEIYHNQILVEAIGHYVSFSDDFAGALFDAATKDFSVAG